MKYTITINQAGIVDAGFGNGRTDLIDWAIIEYIRDWQVAPKAARMGDMVWINLKHLIAEMPLLGLNSKAPISTRISKLKALGLVSVDYDNDRRLYARITEACHGIMTFRADRISSRGGVLPEEQGVLPEEQGGVLFEEHSLDNYISLVNQDSTPYSPPGDECAKDAHTKNQSPPVRGGSSPQHDPGSTLWGQIQPVAGVEAKPATNTPKSGKAASAGEFDAFWQLYPKRVAVGAARRSFDKALQSASFSEIMDGVRRLVFSKPDLKFTPHASTWLNQERWLDEITNGDEHGKAIKRSNAHPTKTDRLNAVIADAIANPPDLSLWRRAGNVNGNDRPMLSGPQPIRERTGTDGGGNPDISSGAGGLPH